MEKEIWKKIIIDDFVTDYYVSSLGRVYSEITKTILKPLPTNSGYVRVRIYYNNSSAYKSIHRLVAIAFLQNIDNLSVVNHKDGNKLNNKVSNLEWASYSDNINHAYIHNLRKVKYGDESHMSKYSRKQITLACQLMEQGTYTLQEIELVTDIDIAMLYLIKRRISWINVSKFYDVENCKQTKSNYSEDDIELVYKLLEENKLSVYDIMDRTGVKTSTIYNIISNRLEKFSYLNEIYDISKYTTYDKINEIPQSIKDEIITRIKNSNISTKDISLEISKSYNINYDKIRHFINRYKNKERSTTIERLLGNRIE